MSAYITSFKNIFRFHKLKILLFFVFFIAFGIMLFPYNDLGDLVTSKVSKLTNNAVYLQFTDLQPSLFPTLGLEFKEVSVDTPFLQAIRAKSLTARPSILSLLTFKPGLSVSAEGLFKGSADVNGSVPGFSQEAFQKPKINAQVKNMDLNEITKALKLPLDLSGKLALETDSLSFNLANLQQVDGEMIASIKDAKIGAMNVNTPLGPLPLPALGFSVIDFNGDAKNGTVKISKFNLGKTGDELSAAAKGQFDIRPSDYGLPLGAYDLSIELEVLSTFEIKMGVLWTTLEGFIESYKRSGSVGKKNYAFRISGQGVMNPPKISPYQ